VTTSADINGYRRIEIGITKNYLGELRALTENLAAFSPHRQRDTLLRVFPDIAVPRIVEMQDFAATWAEDLYAERSASVRLPRPELPADDALEATVRWAVAPAFGETAGTVFDNLAGAGQRYIADAGREVIVGAEPVRRKGSVARSHMRRFPGPGACEWCVDTAGVTAGSHDNCHCVIGPVFEGDPI